jgi:hypothetical protein
MSGCSNIWLTFAFYSLQVKLLKEMMAVSSVRMWRAVLIAWLVTAPLQAQVDERSAAAVVRTLQAAVAQNDRKAVAALIRYPVTVFTGGVRVPVSDASELVRSYDALFSRSLKVVIAQAAFPRRGGPPPSAPIEVSARQITIAGNVVEIEPVGGRLLITGIHVPLSPGSTRTGSGPQDSASRPTRRISIGFGRIEHTGTLAPRQREGYLLSARRNQVLDVRITGVSGRDIVLEIVNVNTRKPIDSKAKEGVRTWVGRIPQDGEYRIDVVRLAARGAAQLRYTLVVSLG